MNKKILLIVVPIVIVVALILLRGLTRLDRVDRHFAEAKMLDEAALSWIPFEKNLLGEAKDISIASDIDTNQYIARWNYNTDAGAFEAFKAEVSKASTQTENIDCAKAKRPECDAMDKVDGMILRAEIPQESGVFNKSIWILDQGSYRVLGAMQIPLPPHL